MINVPERRRRRKGGRVIPKHVRMGKSVLVFGQDAARAAISDGLGQLWGPPGSDFIGSVTVATIFGVLTMADRGLRRFPQDAYGAEYDVQGPAERRADLFPDAPASRRRARLHAGSVAGCQRRAVSLGRVF
jgi:hypothetical protein